MRKQRMLRHNMWTDAAAQYGQERFAGCAGTLRLINDTG